MIFELPLEGVRLDALRVMMIGETDSVLQQALADVPDEVAVTIERIESYPSDHDGLSARLTDRQREVLDAATDLGYYEVPRQANHTDIAERDNLDPSTVSEHLQKIEGRVFDSLAG